MIRFSSPFRAVGFLILSVQLAVANAATYTVGDDVGTWTIPATTNNLNYTAWTEMRNFRFGDELVFKFDSNSHNVVQITESQYELCEVVDPIETYRSGPEKISLDSLGVREYFFTCSLPSHCQLGQKLRITLVGFVPNERPPTPPPAPAPGTLPLSPPLVVLTPSGNFGPSRSVSRLTPFAAIIAIVIYFW